MLFKDLDWYQQCIYKMNYFLEEIKILKEKKDFEVNDQIRINILLNVIKSPMEYATLALVRKVSKKDNAFLPFRQSYYDDKKFKSHIKEKLGYVDAGIYSIFNQLFVDDLYTQFNDMQNNEKHSGINIHRKKIIENSGYGVYGNNIIINNYTSVRDEETKSTGIVINGEEIDITKNEGYTLKNEIYFEYNNREVFEFLDEVYQMVNNFVIDIKHYIENC
ncbi:hypothetical protein ACUXKH_000837 [Staphylococcus epidermidis]|uniref:hypothetical protein n=1 Tax=Staphylococcus epidermidis TaxID=1282 RepID=UPI0020936169|nr:hypothetical protein [Staphylococcus epidermidis]MCG1310310.1 hypothetical protein [Staphylococcus epidermidis]MCO6290096.1 hypothetical protein [Staphylococcus epidermidis]